MTILRLNGKQSYYCLNSVHLLLFILLLLLNNGMLDTPKKLQSSHTPPPQPPKGGEFQAVVADSSIEEESNRHCGAISHTFSNLDTKSCHVTNLDEAGPSISSAIADKQLQFNPTSLNFHEQPVGQPRNLSVRLSNISQKFGLELTSVSGTSSDFHPSFFKSRNLPPGGTTEFEVYFLPRGISRVESTIMIHTSSGLTFPLPVSGIGTENPYKLRAINARIPINYSYHPLITLYNPHSTPLQVLEMYTTDSRLNLELPGNNDSSDLWEIPPFQTKAVMKLSFFAKVVDHHTAFIRVKTNFDKNLTREMIIPVELEVANEDNLFSQLDVLDFGTIRSSDLPHQLNISLNNPSRYPITITSIEVANYDDIISTLPFSMPAKLQPYSTGVAVAALMLRPQNVPTSLNFLYGKVLINASLAYSYSEKKKIQLTIPLRANVYHGHINIPNLSLGSGVLPPMPQTLTLWMSHTFKYQIAVFDAKVEYNSEKFKDYLVLKDYKWPLTILPNDKVIVLSAQFIPNRPYIVGEPRIILYTNMSNFAISVRIYNGLLNIEFIDSKLGEDALDFGIISYNANKTLSFKLTNYNRWPIEDITIYDIRTTCMSLHMGQVELQPISPTHLIVTILESAPFTMKSHSQAVLTFHLRTPPSGDYSGYLILMADYRNIYIPVKYRSISGTIQANPVIFQPSFPSHVETESIIVRSTFTQLVTITDIKRHEPVDPRIYLEAIDSSRPQVRISPLGTAKIARVTFDSLRGYPNKVYTGGFTATQTDSWLSTLDLKSSTHSIDTMFYDRMQAVWRECQNEDLTKATATFEIDTNLMKGVLVEVEATLQWPSITPDKPIEFPLTLVGNYSVRSIPVFNPSNQPLVVQALLLNFYPSIHAALDIVDDWLDISSYTLHSSGVLPYYIKESALPAVVELRDGIHPTLMNDALGYPTSVYTWTAVLPPKSNINVTVVFEPRIEQSVTSAVLFRNNLTVMDAVIIHGASAVGKFTINSISPGSNDHLLFEMTEEKLAVCKTSQLEQVSLANLNITKEFMARNSGKLPIHIESIFINTELCQGYGFVISQCKPFSLKPNSSYQMEISFTPDFSLTEITRQLILNTRHGQQLIFTLHATIPKGYLHACSQLVPKLPWETYLSLMLLPAVMALLLAVYMGYQYSSAVPSSTSTADSLKFSAEEIKYLVKIAREYTVYKDNPELLLDLEKKLYTVNLEGVSSLRYSEKERELFIRNLVLSNCNNNPANNSLPDSNINDVNNKPLKNNNNNKTIPGKVTGNIDAKNDTLKNIHIIKGKHNNSQKISNNRNNITSSSKAVINRDEAPEVSKQVATRKESPMAEGTINVNTNASTDSVFIDSSKSNTLKNVMPIKAQTRSDINCKSTNSSTSSSSSSGNCSSSISSNSNNSSSMESNSNTSSPRDSPESTEAHLPANDSKLIPQQTYKGGKKERKKPSKNQNKPEKPNNKDFIANNNNNNTSKHRSEYNNTRSTQAENAIYIDQESNDTNNSLSKPEKEHKISLKPVNLKPLPKTAGTVLIRPIPIKQHSTFTDCTVTQPKNVNTTSTTTATTTTTTATTIDNTAIRITTNSTADDNKDSSIDITDVVNVSSHTVQSKVQTQTNVNKQTKPLVHPSSKSTTQHPSNSKPCKNDPTLSANGNNEKSYQFLKAKTFEKRNSPKQFSLRTDPAPNNKIPEVTVYNKNTTNTAILYDTSSSMKIYRKSQTPPDLTARISPPDYKQPKFKIITPAPTSSPPNTPAQTTVTTTTTFLANPIATTTTIPANPVTTITAFPANPVATTATIPANTVATTATIPANTVATTTTIPANTVATTTTIPITTATATTSIPVITVATTTAIPVTTVARTIVQFPTTSVTSGNTSHITTNAHPFTIVNNKTNYEQSSHITSGTLDQELKSTPIIKNATPPLTPKLQHPTTIPDTNLPCNNNISHNDTKNNSPNSSLERSSPDSISMLSSDAEPFIPDNDVLRKILGEEAMKKGPDINRHSPNKSSFHANKNKNFDCMSDHTAQASPFQSHQQTQLNYSLTQIEYLNLVASSLGIEANTLLLHLQYCWLYYQYNFRNLFSATASGSQQDQTLQILLQLLQNSSNVHSPTALSNNTNLYNKTTLKEDALSTNHIKKSPHKHGYLVPPHYNNKLVPNSRSSSSDSLCDSAVIYSKKSNINKKQHNNNNNNNINKKYTGDASSHNKNRPRYSHNDATPKYDSHLLGSPFAQKQFFSPPGTWKEAQISPLPSKSKYLSPEDHTSKYGYSKTRPQKHFFPSAATSVNDVTQDDSSLFTNFSSTADPLSSSGPWNPIYSPRKPTMQISNEWSSRMDSQSSNATNSKTIYTNHNTHFSLSDLLPNQLMASRTSSPSHAMTDSPPRMHSSLINAPNSSPSSNNTSASKTPLLFVGNSIWSTTRDTSEEDRRISWNKTLTGTSNSMNKAPAQYEPFGDSTWAPSTHLEKAINPNTPTRTKQL